MSCWRSRRRERLDREVALKFLSSRLLEKRAGERPGSVKGVAEELERVDLAMRE